MKTPLAVVIAIVVSAGCAGQQTSSTPPITATPTGSSAESAEPAAPTALEDIEPGTSLQPGTYVLHYASIGGADQFPTLAATFTVPDGWERVRVDGLLWNDEGARLGFVVVDNQYVDPCDPSLGLRTPPIGPSVDDLTSALLTVPGWENALVSEDAFYGFRGQAVDFTSSMSCPGDEESKLFHTLGSPGYTLAPDDGDHVEIRVLNVAGTRFVLIAVATADASTAAIESMQSVLDSIEIQP